MEEKQNKFTSTMTKIGKKILQYTLIAFEKMKWSLIAVGIGLLIGLIVMFIFNPSGAIPGLSRLLFGAFTTGLKGVGDVILYATPIILTGTALVITFKSGLFNIGAPGQMVVGAYVAIFVGVNWPLPPVIHWLVALLLGTLAGAIWAAIPGLLKAFRNVNEVVSSIMLNYIATFLVVYLVKTTVYNAAYAKSQNVLATAELPVFSFLFGTSKANLGFLIAIVVVAVVHIIFKMTTLGYELKATGFNPEASKYAGMNAKRNTVLSFVLSGAIVGLAGAIQFLVNGTNLGTTYTLLPEGFDGISVALLGMTEPIGAFISGLFLSYIRQGGFYMQIYGFSPQIVEIIIGIIVFFTSLTAGIQLYIKIIKQKRLARKNAESEEVK